MSKQKLLDDKRCIRNDVTFAENCSQTTDGKCSYEYSINGDRYSGSFNCNENDFFNVLGKDLIFKCPSGITALGIDGHCNYNKTYEPTTGSHFSTNFPGYIIVGIISVIVIFLTIFFILKITKSKK